MSSMCGFLYIFFAICGLGELDYLHSMTTTTERISLQPYSSALFSHTSFSCQATHSILVKPPTQFCMSAVRRFVGIVVRRRAADALLRVFVKRAIVAALLLFGPKLA